MLSTLLLTACLLDPAADPTTQAFEALRAEPNLPRTPARCAPLEAAALQALTAAAMTGEKLWPCVVRITANGKHPIAVLAKKLEAIQVRMLFDAGYLLDAPYAAANFNAQDKVLHVPVSLFAQLTLDDPALQHELVHVAIWAAAHKDESTMVAYLHGDPYQPNDLALDEMRAYGEDLTRAASLFKAKCNKASAQSWPAIWERRKKDEPGLKDLSGCDLLFDRVAAKIVFGRNHTDPAIPALEALSTVFIGAEVTGDITETMRRGAMTIDGKAVPIELHLVRLAPKRNPDDGATVRALLAQARTYQTFWQKSGETVDRLSKAQPKELPGLLDTLMKRAKPPMATPVF